MELVLDESVKSDDCSVRTNPESANAHGSTSFRSSAEPGAAGATEDENVLAKKETKIIGRIKIFVSLVLLTSMACVGCAVYYFLHTSQKAKFETRFEDDAAKVLQSVGSTIDLTLTAVDAFLVSVSSFAQYTNASWPLVTVPNYAVRLSKIRTLSKAVLVAQYNLVSADQRAAWEKYSTENDGWVDEALVVQKKDKSYKGKVVEKGNYTTSPYINQFQKKSPDDELYLPKWQQSPVVPVYVPYNWNAFSLPSLREAFPTIKDRKQVVIGPITNYVNSSDPDSVALVELYNAFMKDFVGDIRDHTEPFSDIYYPILDNAAEAVAADEADSPGNVVGVFGLTLYWRDLFRDKLPQGSDGIIVVLSNNCQETKETISYQINGPETVYLGQGDRHDTRYDKVGKTRLLQNSDALQGKDSARAYTGLPLATGHCPYTISVYPSQEMEDQFVTSTPIIFTLVAISIFVFTGLVFKLYDVLVERRQQKVMHTAVRTNALVSSLFPSNVRERLFSAEKITQEVSQRRRLENRLKSFLRDKSSEMNESSEAAVLLRTRPIADLFLETTVMMADIAGFTAWSSTREPFQVFTLLETLYGAFDAIAARRGVFKVETIGDSYVAVCGLPDPNKDHAVVICKFARDCRAKMDELTRGLESTLGPGTSELGMRIGLHSGPVTAGVLRGERSRFQLFGDTINTAARMESNGVRGKIQISQETANEIIDSGKGHWLTKRSELVEAKGKGMLQTYFVEPTSSLGGTTRSSENGSIYVMTEEPITEAHPKIAKTSLENSVDWNVIVWSKFIGQIISNRTVSNAHDTESRCVPSTNLGCGTLPIHEVADVIDFPKFNDAMRESTRQLSDIVEQQLSSFIKAIASKHRINNRFHNFEHASHVAMSNAKLVGRIVTPNQDSEVYHNGTLGITFDPLTKFACVFSALVHDVDHPGIPNTALVAEKNDIASKYENKSVAEQNSIDVAWELFMRDEYQDLRGAICHTDEELRRFRQLVVNSVMATDVIDKEINDLRKARWERSFDSTSAGDEEESQQDAANLMATVVIEYLMQASDVAHTMQHWHIFRKWNGRLFEEMYKAYLDGRVERNPADSWYESEIDFFDYYVVPLAKKIDECGIFGVSSWEFLDYATKNRAEWERRGREVVAEMMEKVASGSEGQT